MKGLYYPIAQHLQQFCQEGEFVIWRDSFRWKDINDQVMCNHYECHDLDYLAETFNYEIHWEYNFKHVAIVRKK